MKELMATLSAIYQREHRQMRFMAALQGVDIDKDKNTEEGGPVSFEEVKARAIGKITGNLEAANAARFGFDQLDGTGYNVVGLDNGTS